MIRIRYRIDTQFNGVVKSFFVIQKLVGTWPFRRWVSVHEETIYEGNSTTEAQEAIDKRVAYERDSEVKFRSWKDDRGDTPYGEYGYM